MSEMYEKGKKRTALCDQIKLMLIDQLGLETTANFITNDQPLFGRGLELDSIDSLDVAVGVFEVFGIQIDDDNTEIFASVNKLADFIQEQQEE